jgi:hypothetical protein
VLWLYGIRELLILLSAVSIPNEPTAAGCGKTVLSSTIVENILEEHARDSKASIAYFYFDFREEDRHKNVEGFLRSLLRQLSERELPAVVETLSKDNPSPDIDKLTDTLKTVLQQVPTVFLDFDALDECTEVKILMKTIAKIKKWGLPGVRILATSRKESDVTQTMDSLSLQSICLETALVDEDIKTFVKHNFESGGRLGIWSDDANARKEIEDTLAAGSKGM